MLPLIRCLKVLSDILRLSLSRDRRKINFRKSDHPKIFCHIIAINFQYPLANILKKSLNLIDFVQVLLDSTKDFVYNIFSCYVKGFDTHWKVFLWTKKHLFEENIMKNFSQKKWKIELIVNNAALVWFVRTMLIQFSNNRETSFNLWLDWL